MSRVRDFALFDAIVPLLAGFPLCLLASLPANLLAAELKADAHAELSLGTFDYLTPLPGDTNQFGDKPIKGHFLASRPPLRAPSRFS